MLSFTGSIFKNARRYFYLTLAKKSIAAAQKSPSRSTLNLVKHYTFNVALNEDLERLGFSLDQFQWLVREVLLAEAKSHLQARDPENVLRANERLHEAHAGPEEIGCDSEDFDLLHRDAKLTLARVSLQNAQEAARLSRAAAVQAFGLLHSVGAAPEAIETTEAELRRLGGYPASS